MGYSYDFFVAALTCPTCGSVSKENHTTRMQTYIRDEETDGAFMGVGFPLVLQLPEMEDLKYISILPVVEGTTIRIGHPWICTPCNWARHWAVIEVAGNVIQKIENIDLKKELIKLNYVHFDIVDEIHSVLGISYDDLMDSDISTLSRKLYNTEE